MRILVLTVVTVVGLWTVAAYLRSFTNDAQVSAVIGEIHRLQTEQVDFYSRHGRYAGSIGELAPELEHANGSYRYRISANGNSYTIEAKPVNGHGNAFFSDETLAIRSVRTD